MTVLSRRMTTRSRSLVALAAAGALAATSVGLADGARSSAASVGRAASAGAAAYQRHDGSGKQRGYVSVSGADSARGIGTNVTTSTRGGSAHAQASARMRRVSIFGGLVRADAVSVSAYATGSGASKDGRVSGLSVDGARKGTVTAQRSYALGGYGKLVALDGSGHGIVGLRATLTRAYKSYRAGASVTIAYAAASARDAAAAPKAATTTPRPSKPNHTRPSAKPGAPKQPAKAKRRRPSRTKRLLTAQGFVFPVYGKHSFSDDWGAPRQDTGIHQGNDIFAATGTPAVAVCDGTLHRVGTRPVPGNRLWVKCNTGDAFFYGHLSAFASDAHSGARVGAGQVVGFVGSTGDAEQTPPHVHFEVHPGDAKAVDPYPFLRAWENRRDVPAAAWVRRNGAVAGQQPGTLVVVRDFLDR